MSAHVTAEDLQHLSNELELYGLPSLPLDSDSDCTASSVLPFVIESCWNLMELNRARNKSSRVSEADTSQLVTCVHTLERENKRLAYQLATSAEQVKLLTDKLSAANKRSLEHERSFKAVQSEARLLQERLCRSEKNRVEIVKRTKKETDAYMLRIQELLGEGLHMRHGIDQTLPCSERESILKQVICKYHEENEALIAQQLSMMPRISDAGGSFQDEDNGEGLYDDNADNSRDSDTSMRVSNLPTMTTKSNFEELLKPFGPIKKYYVAKDKKTGLCKGFAYVHFKSKSDAAKAFVELNGRCFHGSVIGVHWIKSL